MPQKRKAYFLRRPALLLALAALLSGCRAMDVFSVDSLLRAPKLTGENARIQQSFEAAVGKDVLLSSPLTGSSRSAFVPFDYDADGFEEMLVFYAYADAPNEIHMHFMDLEGEDWVSAGDVTGNGSEVYNVEFLDLDGAAPAEILISWTVSDSKRNKTLTVYRYAGEEGFTQLTALQIYEYLALDLDADGFNEILYLSSDTAVQPQVIRATAIKMDGAAGSFLPVSETELSHSVEFPLACAHDQANGMYRIYYDCINFDDTYMTEILLFDTETGTLVRPQDEEGAFLCQRTHRSEEIFCRQSGGTVTVPVRSVYEDGRLTDSENDLETDLYCVEYQKLESDGTLTPVSGRYVYLPAEGVRMRVDAFYETYIAEYRIAQRELRFSLRESPETQVFTVRFLTPPENAPAGENYRIYITAPGAEGVPAESQIAAAIEQLS